ncbi:hypothetical protein GW579_15540 [Rahnella sp. Lac-M11]|jgi:hypothetical protein|uniref:Uncharacterized protein n=1 Tax=Rahnella contaminans TaxID=2703882 RepID=A0A6M2B781_9GAMM|nr:MULTISPECIES: hypothetical protein [unclassified Rahnella]MBU9818857.1 hypothetical protein [Rahnella sp. BCC 1045]MCS3424713.1 hypothetical protein [Rahnella sp. BIGb0603]NGX88491.1 hypothetical protein [Rahnella contaminans]
MAKLQRFKRTTSQIDNNLVSTHGNAPKKTDFGQGKTALKEGVNLRHTPDCARLCRERKVLFKSGWQITISAR